ncbi:hypothetical protein HMPREF1318_1210 [Actinomyces massiliensis F0489]|uniref:Uncharacterized protein n=1 Tax=Actinomyces massiliensis F0489 TaxID=1125718 RepID=J1HMB4_9ACTO|nr:hypothetical protein HMPREF1318_1210 [Actinomyces massiliensis F0489]
MDRSRAGVRPISVRKWTELESEYDRSRRKVRLRALIAPGCGRPRFPR